MFLKRAQKMRLKTEEDLDLIEEHTEEGDDDFSEDLDFLDDD